MKKIIQVLLLSFFSLGLMAQTTIYTNDMDYVIGDVKQAFIQDKISTVAQINFLLAGFNTMKVNGIRVPIFPKGLEPNEPALKYFIEEAIKEGFDIFANPAQGTGGKHLATGEFFSDISVKDDPVMTQNLIDRTLEFDKTYACKWINPFNEDSRTNTVWSTDQMNAIYKGVKEGLVNAELIGSCAWGLGASLDIFNKTNIKDYITVSTSHNLGFEHSKWKTFIDLSHAAGLPVWDSEVNHNRKYEDKATRLEAALSYGVDGLVLYDSWKNINMTSGVVNDAGQVLMSMYIKPAALNEKVSSDSKLFELSSFDGGFVVRLSEASPSCELRVYDISGRMMYNVSQSNSDIFTVDQLDKGSYILMVKSGDDLQSQKVIVY